ncbi:MAG: hypothetical protein HOK52_10005 [Candidatus Marinimicrobia bacterium]|jgi:hypothetical protein|nr:hypothetical protein [Candidatus Neomarinimicrobiota bacterium]MBT3936720.1 hypothetical protein [Candidatus Neomarinimicrobiota bacterium]MBT3960563.1 hypothetical protein [Candidatus Neomarinimicrobiota bacterium]MBT4382500.1 hypothetical protein [Candidatus Neomarinimicrobiota bacterium]MBT4637019.1 hypothetical protein [Candidatus Neomarinimicrobiota bacterium]
MERYQFEDLISDYLENTLTIAQRKSFDSYLESNPKAKQLVDNMKNNINELNELPKVKTSAAFMKNLQGRLSAERRIPVESTAKSFLGFTPLYATVMTGLVVAFLFVSIELFNPEKPNLPILNKTFATHADEGSISNKHEPTENDDNQNLADVESDSLDQLDDDIKKKDYSKQIHLVND